VRFRYKEQHRRTSLRPRHDHYRPSAASVRPSRTHRKRQISIDREPRFPSRGFFHRRLSDAGLAQGQRIDRRHPKPITKLGTPCRPAQGHFARRIGFACSIAASCQRPEDAMRDYRGGLSPHPCETVIRPRAGYSGTS
jgi:hypothetical protein